MTDITNPHVADAVLTEFVLGKLPDADGATVEQHLADCPDCLSRAAAVRPDDRLLTLLATVAGRTTGRSADATPADLPATYRMDCRPRKRRRRGTALVVVATAVTVVLVALAAFARWGNDSSTPRNDPPSPQTPTRPALPAVTDFREAHGLDLAGLRTWLADLPPGFRPEDITARSGAVPPRFDGVAVRDGRTPPFDARLDLDRTGQPATSDYRVMHRDGWALRAVCPFEDGRSRPRHHVWVKDGGPWFAYGLTLRDVPDEVAYWQQEGRRPRAVYLNGRDPGRGNPDRPIGVLLVPDDGRPWAFAPELTPDEFAAKVADARARGWRPDTVGQMGAGANRTFALSVVANPDGRAWTFEADMPVARYEAAVAEHKARGLRPLAVASAGVGDAVRYAAVWIEYGPTN